jgi:hypothetical protein
MVRESLERLLPEVMNEVLLRAIANSGVMTERREPASRQPPVRPQARRSSQQQKPRRPDLSGYLDESAGADFYERAVSRMPQRDDDATEETVSEERQAPSLSSRLNSLPPELREMAEDMDLSADTDFGSVDPSPVAAGKSIGLDFSAMKRTINMTEGSKGPALDPRAKAKFEEQRIARMRAELDGGKQV